MTCPFGLAGGVAAACARGAGEAAAEQRRAGCAEQRAAAERSHDCRGTNEGTPSASPRVPASLLTRAYIRAAAAVNAAAGNRAMAATNSATRAVTGLQRRGGG